MFLIEHDVFQILVPDLFAVPSRTPIRNGARLPKGDEFLHDTNRENIYCMMEQSPRGKAGDIRVACCRYKKVKGIRSGEMASKFHPMRPHLYPEMFDTLHRAFGDSPGIRPSTSHPPVLSYRKRKSMHNPCFLWRMVLDCSTESGKSCVPVIFACMEYVLIV